MLLDTEILVVVSRVFPLAGAMMREEAVVARVVRVIRVRLMEAELL